MNFIAEVSSNHHQDLNRAFQFIDAAADAQCTAVKFQLFKIDQLFSHVLVDPRSSWEYSVAISHHFQRRSRSATLTKRSRPPERNIHDFC